MSVHSANSISLGLKWIAEYHGPNHHAKSAVVVGELTGEAWQGIVKVNAACADLWPQSGVVHCAEGASTPADGDLLLALAQTAVAWTQAVLNEVRGFVLDAGAERAGEGVRLWVGFHHAPLSRAALQLALRTLAQLIEGHVASSALKAELHRLWLSCRQRHPDYQARILMVGARDMGVPCLQFLPGSRYWQFGWGARSRVFMESSSNADGALGSQWQKSKATAKALMTALGLPTPGHVLMNREDDLPPAVERVGFPCVVKPLDAGGGKGVTANIWSLADARTAYRVAFSQKQGVVMVEAHVPGDDHRLMVIDGRFVAAIRREPSFVVGDGHKTVATLVAELNAPRSSNLVRSRYLRLIALDEVLERHLATQSLRLTDAPAPGQRVSLRSNANLSTGGMCTDVTSICHPAIQAMAVLLAKTSGLTTIGIDYLTTDIASAPAETGGAFIEMNSTPGLDACVAAGWSEASIARLVLGEAVGRIAVDLTVLSAAGVQALRAGSGTPHVADEEALAIDDELCVGETRLRIVSTEPWAAVRAGLRNAMVRSMQVICSAPALERLGCPAELVRQATVAVCDGEPVLPPDWIEVLERHSQNALVYQEEKHMLAVRWRS